MHTTNAFKAYLYNWILTLKYHRNITITIKPSFLENIYLMCHFMCYLKPHLNLMTLIIDNGSWGCKSGLSTQDKPFILFSAALDETDSFTGQGDAERLEKALKCTFKCLNDASIGLKVN